MAVLAISLTSCTFFDQSRTCLYGILGMIGSSVQGQPALERSQVRARLARLAKSAASRPHAVPALR